MRSASRVFPADPELGMGNFQENFLNRTERLALNVGTCLCITALVVLAVVALIVGFVGLAHTQHTTLDPMCPAGYWNESLGLILSRLFFFTLFFILAASVKCCCSQAVCAVVCTTVLGLCLIFTFTVANTVVTARAWNAPNCSTAVRASRDTDPLLMASGSLFILFDWIVLITGCACVIYHTDKE
jgi:hypothetical protein